MAELADRSGGAEADEFGAVRECDKRLFAIAREFGAWTRFASHITTVAARKPGFEVYGPRGVVWLDRHGLPKLGLWTVLDYKLPIGVREAEKRCGFVKEGKQARRNYVFGSIPEQMIARAIEFVSEEPDSDDVRARGNV